MAGELVMITLTKNSILFAFSIFLIYSCGRHHKSRYTSEIDMIEIDSISIQSRNITVADNKLIDSINRMAVEFNSHFPNVKGVYGTITHSSDNENLVHIQLTNSKNYINDDFLINEIKGSFICSGLIFYILKEFNNQNNFSHLFYNQGEKINTTFLYIVKKNGVKYIDNNSVFFEKQYFIEGDKYLLRAVRFYSDSLVFNK